MKTVFLGQKTYFEDCVDSLRSGLNEVVFVDYRISKPIDEAIKEVESYKPDLLIVFKPEILPRNSLLSLSAKKVGWFTEPIAEKSQITAPESLLARFRNLENLDASQFDFFISFNPEFTPLIEKFVTIDAEIPLPVADNLYDIPKKSAEVPRFLFTGRMTPHRELFLEPLLDPFDVSVITHGSKEAHTTMSALLSNHDVVINLHTDSYKNFEHRVSMALSKGLLVLSEPLNPQFGLEPGIDYLEFKTPDELLQICSGIRRYPFAWENIRKSGRSKSEFFRFSNLFGYLSSFL